MDYEKLKKLAMDTGFTHTAPLDINTIELKQEVRDMCTQGCQQYKKRWSCPPGCGSLEQIHSNISRYQGGILVQTAAKLEDSFDWDGMMQAQTLHQQNFVRLIEKLHSSSVSFLPLGTGCCMICETCSYPDSPCRFPQKKISSMEACGMLVSEVCQKNELKYYYGPNTISYVAGILFQDFSL